MSTLDIINAISNAFTACGTVSAVAVALWLAYRDNKPRLRVNATLSVMDPERHQYLWLFCTNIGKQPIVCTGFSLNPNAYKKRGKVKRIGLLHPTVIPSSLHKQVPALLQYSENVVQYFSEELLEGKNIKDFLSQYRWLAKVQLKFCWRIVGHTNIKTFEGKLSKCLIEKILELHFKKNDTTSTYVK